MKNLLQYTEALDNFTTLLLNLHSLKFLEDLLKPTVKGIGLLRGIQHAGVYHSGNVTSAKSTM
jgi:hypothetical protein